MSRNAPGGHEGGKSIPGGRRKEGKERSSERPEHVLQGTRTAQQRIGGRQRPPRSCLCKPGVGCGFEPRVPESDRSSLSAGRRHGPTCWKESSPLAAAVSDWRGSLVQRLLS